MTAPAAPLARLDHLGRGHACVDLPALVPDLSRVPFARRVLCENLARHGAPAEAVALAGGAAPPVRFHPARILMQDMLGLPLLTDLAALREAVAARGVDPERVDLAIPAHLVVDHAMTVFHAGTPDALERNEADEHAINRERFAFLRWCQGAFRGLEVVPPGNGILHQVNLEHLGRCVREGGSTPGGAPLLFPDTVLGTDSHTPMINALGILGWGVGGLEAEAALLGRPVILRGPRVVGVRLIGALPPGGTATDLALRITERLRAEGVVGAFVEFCGPGLESLAVPDRATLANMAPEYGATCGYFPVDAAAVAFLRLAGHGDAHAALVEAWARAAGLWREAGGPEPEFDGVVEIDLAAVPRSIAGPRRPQDRVALHDAPERFDREITFESRRVPLDGAGESLGDGDVVLAAITSCTNTANPRNMVAAGLLARAAVERGLSVPGRVKTSMTLGSRVVADYLRDAGLQPHLDALGFHVAGFSCATCNGMSGPLAPPVEAAIRDGDLACAAVLSGNRNFEGRIHPLVRANYIMSPPLVVAYALAGSVRVDVSRAPLGRDPSGAPVFLADLWPEPAAVDETVRRHVEPALFERARAHLPEGGPRWDALGGAHGGDYAWDEASTYIRRAPYLEGVTPAPPATVPDLAGLRPLVVLGDSVTTDHISPSGTITVESAAGRYLLERGVTEREFNSYGTRRANPEVVLRSLFANVRLRNEMVGEREGSVTRLLPGGETVSVFEAVTRYREAGTPLLVVAGREYGCGSSRDTAAKAPWLAGVRAVLAEGFERIHRSNLVNMGILPLEFAAGTDRASPGIEGAERFDVLGLEAAVAGGAEATVRATAPDGAATEFPARVRLDTPDEVLTYRHGGLLPRGWRDFSG